MGERKNTPTPNPGSTAAIDAGCTCPVIDNRYGEGIVMRGERVWWQTTGCPVHEREEHDDG